MKRLSSDPYVRGWTWAYSEFKKGTPLNEIEEKADNAFDFNEFDRGAMEAVRDMQNMENKT